MAPSRSWCLTLLFLMRQPRAPQLHDNVPCHCEPESVCEMQVYHACCGDASAWLQCSHAILSAVDQRVVSLLEWACRCSNPPGHCISGHRRAVCLRNRFCTHPCYERLSLSALAQCRRCGSVPPCRSSSSHYLSAALSAEDALDMKQTDVSCCADHFVREAGIVSACLIHVKGARPGHGALVVTTDSQAVVVSAARLDGFDHSVEDL